VQAWRRPHPVSVLGLGCVASVGFTAALSIFAVIYSPVLALGAATRNFDEYLHYAPQPIDILNVGENNLVWSGMIRALHLIPDDRLGFNELSIALTPVVQILLLASALISSRPGFWPADVSGRISRAVVIASASACALVFVVTVQINHESLFHLFYGVLPGANAIRVGYRAMIVANLFAVTAISLACQQAFRTLRESRTNWSLVGSGVLIVLLSLTVVEQVNLAQATLLSRKDEREHLSVVGVAPRQCRAFYAASHEDVSEDLQADAMMVAQAQNLPTLNGYSGFTPPGWDLGKTDTADYEQRVLRWALHRDIAEGLCRLDIDSGHWMLDEQQSQQ
jgi:hypothetical protein